MDINYIPYHKNIIKTFKRKICNEFFKGKLYTKINEIKEKGNQKFKEMIKKN